MKTLIKIALIVITFSEVHAQNSRDWTKVKENESGRIFIAPSTAVISDATVRIWTLWVDKNKSKGPVKSAETQMIFECKEKRFRQIEGTIYTYDGRTVKATRTDWEFINPDSEAETKMIAVASRILCKRSSFVLGRLLFILICQQQ